VLGLSNVRIAYTAGEAIGPDLFSFYRSLGLNLEAALRPDRSVPLSDGAARRPDFLDTVGPALPNVDLRIAENGEVLVQVARHVRQLLQGRDQDPGGDHARWLCEDRRCRLLRTARPGI